MAKDSKKVKEEVGAEGPTAVPGVPVVPEPTPEDVAAIEAAAEKEAKKNS